LQGSAVERIKIKNELQNLQKWNQNLYSMVRSLVTHKAKKEDLVQDFDQ
jgi:hypothetical protein